MLVEITMKKIIIGKWYDLGTIEIAYLDGAIYYARLKKDETMTLDCLRKSIDFRKEYGIEDAYFILEFGEFSTTDLDTRLFSMNRTDEPFKAEAFITRNLAQKIIVDNYVKLNKRKIPFARFDSSDEAFSWIESLKKSEKSA